MKNIEFFTTISGVEDTYPIIESCKFRPSWVALAKEQYKQKIKAFEDHGQRLFHIYNCPGIFDIMQTGYIICCPWDITIQTTGDYKSFLWNVPSNDINILNSNQPVVGGHFPDDIAEFLPKKHGCMHTIIRISTPWHVVSPPNVKFIIHPIPYSDDDIFEQTLGILDPSISTRLNAQLYWKNIQGSYTIKAGTPLFQIIPLSSEKFTFSIKYASEKQFQWLTKKQYFFNMSFFSKDHILKKLYLKHFWPNFTGTT